MSEVMVRSPVTHTEHLRSSKEIGEEELGKALILHAGSISRAAVDLQIDRKGLAHRIEVSKELQALLVQIDERLLDAARSNVAEAILGGDLKTSKWWLERKGAHLGFSNRVQVEAPGGGAVKTEITVRVRYVDPLPVADEGESE